MEYYALRYQLGTIQQYLLWMTDIDSSAKDTVALGPDRRILSFKALKMLQDYASHNGFALIPQDLLALHDLDWVTNWLKDPSVETVDCNHVLTAWNLFTDIYHSIEKDRDVFKAVDEQNQVIYDKIFFGNNLPAITPKGEQYLPSWNSDEVDILCAVLSAGLEMFCRNLTPARAGKR
ncbi:MAG: hypothetical protein AAF329_20020 [Cyanobacteria bacterium P01_A01_bin.17]